MPLDTLSQRNKPYLTDADRLSTMSQRNKPYLPSATRNAVAGASAAQGTEIADPTGSRDGLPGFSGSAANMNARPTVLTTGSVNGFAPDADQPYQNNDPYKVPTSSQRNQLVGGSLPSMSSGMNTVQMPRSAGMFAPNEGPTIRVGTYTPPPQAVRSGAPTWADMVGRKQERIANQQRTNQQIADAATMRAMNEFPLAQLQSSTTERGQDIGFQSARMQDVTSRRGQDVQQRGQNLQFDSSAASDLTHRAGIEAVAGASKYRTDTELAAHLPDMERKQRINDLNAAGNYDQASALATQEHPRVPPAAHTAIDSTSQHVITTHPSGEVSYNSMKDLQDAAKVKREAALKASAAQVKKDEDDRKARLKAEGK